MASSLERVENVVDAHHHFWSPKTHSWLEKVADSGHPAGPFRPVLQYDYEAFKADSAPFNVTKSVHVQAHHDGEPVEETKWLQDIADKTGFPSAIVAFADLSKPDVEDVLKQHCQYANVRGIRQMIDYHPTVEAWRQCAHGNYMTDANWLAGLKLLPKYNLSFDIQLHVPQLLTAAKVIRENPEVQFILNHAGFPALLTDDYLKTWREGMAALAENSNIVVKISAFNDFHHDWNKEMFRPLVEYVIKTFSTNRCMFASNFPVDKINAGYMQLMGTYFDICCDMGLSQADVNMMFRDNALKYYRI